MSQAMLPLDALYRQEQELVFDRFDNEQAIALGLQILETARAAGHALTIDVTRCHQQVFHAALAGTSLDNDRWIERKRAVVYRFGHASLTMRRMCDEDGKDLATRFQLDPLAFAAFGGSFPITVRGVGMVGTVTVSGLPHETDHVIVTEALECFLKLRT